MAYSCTGKKEPSNLRNSNTTPDKPVTFEQAKKDWRINKGVGPIKNVKLGDIKENLVNQGQDIFQKNCTACHMPYKEKIGPALVGVTERRTPEWIMNMILNPVEMVKTDPICLGLLAQFNTVMADQNLTQEEARSVLEYFRTLKLDNTTDPS
jgi:mono/diheme cytochrome c family protein